ncbi:MAG TPA: hypothetical protein DEB25_04945 [Desulfobulbaceae bacterium]|nr:hypothetical protein [Desulfobulbaceae bacterium]
MQLFVPINENDVEGYKRILLLLLFSDEPLNIWAPAAGFIEMAHNANPKYFGHKTFLNAVEADLIRPNAREGYWDCNGKMRKSHFEAGKFNGYFDGELARIVKSNSGEQKILQHPPEEGYIKADQELAKEISCLKEMAWQLYNRFDPQKSNLPKGMIDKVKREYDKGSTNEDKEHLARREILRNAFNDADSLKCSTSNKYFYYKNHGKTFNDFIELVNKCGTREDYDRPLLQTPSMTIDEIDEYFVRLHTFREDKDILDFFIGDKTSDAAFKLRQNVCYYAYIKNYYSIEEICATQLPQNLSRPECLVNVHTLFAKEMSEKVDDVTADSSHRGALYVEPK